MTDDDIRRLIALLQKVAACRARMWEAEQYYNLATRRLELVAAKLARLRQLCDDLDWVDDETVSKKNDKGDSFMDRLNKRIESAESELSGVTAEHNAAGIPLATEETELIRLHTALTGWRIATPSPMPNDVDF